MHNTGIRLESLQARQSPYIIKQTTASGNILVILPTNTNGAAIHNPIAGNKILARGCTLLHRSAKMPPNKTPTNDTGCKYPVAYKPASLCDKLNPSL